MYWSINIFNVAELALVKECDTAWKGSEEVKRHEDAGGDRWGVPGGSGVCTFAYRYGIECIVLEARSRENAESRIRAGVQERQLAELEYVVSSAAASTLLAESYVGMPIELE